MDFSESESGTAERISAEMKAMVNSDFYHEYYLQIKTIVIRILQCSNQLDEVEDCVNTVFLEIINKTKKYDEQRGNINAFVAVIARSTALNFRKKNIRKSGELIGDENLDFLSAPIKYQDEIEFNLLVETIISKLNKRERLLFTMRYLYFYSPEEIAKTLNIKRSAVDMRTNRLKNKIKKYLIKGGIIL